MGDEGVKTAATSAAPAIAPTPRKGPHEGVATTFVNMRQAPEMDAQVITVLPKGARLAVFECDGWCRVRFDGRDGYVFGTYVDAGAIGGPDGMESASAPDG